jgi:type IV pilus assembly protein PilW
MRSPIKLNHQSMRGLSLIELMIGVALSMLAMVAIYQVMSVWDARRRTITAGSSAQISGGIGIAELERDMQLAGMGLGNITSATINCTVNAYNSTLATNVFTFSFVPVQIVDGASGAPDVVRVLYGNSAYVVNIQKVNASASGAKTLQYRTGFNAGDLVVVSGNTPRVCNMYEVTGNSGADAVTILHGSAAYTSFYTGASVTPTMNNPTATNPYTEAEIYDLGPGAQLTEWRLTSGVLTRRNLLRSDTAAEVTEGIVNLQAEYGIDTSHSGSVSWTATAPTDWTTVLAVRIAVLSRSSQMESDAVTTTIPSWGGGNFTMYHVDGTLGTTSTTIANDWHHYRYRVYETVIPLRNMLWGATS